MCVVEEPRARLWGSHEAPRVDAEEPVPSVSDTPATAPAPKRPREETER